MRCRIHHKGDAGCGSNEGSGQQQQRHTHIYTCMRTSPPQRVSQLWPAGPAGLRRFLFAARTAAAMISAHVHSLAGARHLEPPVDDQAGGYDDVPAEPARGVWEGQGSGEHERGGADRLGCHRWATEHANVYMSSRHGLTQYHRVRHPTHAHMHMHASSQARCHQRTGSTRCTGSPRAAAGGTQRGPTCRPRRGPAPSPQTPGAPPQSTPPAPAGAKGDAREGSGRAAQGEGGVGRNRRLWQSRGKPPPHEGRAHR